ncbi:MAG: hypothetical protein WDN28_19020 [Chthoniobacter sp.]
MHAPANPFLARKSSARTFERVAFGFFRVATYFILVCAAFIFGLIFYKGGQTVFRANFPFVNVPFLTQAPETLYVFQYEGKKMELGDRDFREFKRVHAIADIPAESYVYSAGGIFPCIVGTALLVVGSMAIALFIGVSSAIYLNEYSTQGRFVYFVRLAILNLAGVPSIVFGLFGLGLFVVFMPVLQGFSNPTVLSLPVGFWHYLNFSGWNVCLLSGWFTLAFMALPVVITASEESLKSVPKGFREGSLALRRHPLADHSHECPALCAARDAHLFDSRHRARGGRDGADHVYRRLRGARQDAVAGGPRARLCLPGRDGAPVSYLRRQLENPAE